MKTLMTVVLVALAGFAIYTIISSSMFGQENKILEYLHPATSSSDSRTEMEKRIEDELEGTSVHLYQAIKKRKRDSYDSLKLVHKRMVDGVKYQYESGFSIYLLLKLRSLCNSTDISVPVQLKSAMNFPDKTREEKMLYLDLIMSTAEECLDDQSYKQH